MKAQIVSVVVLMLAACHPAERSSQTTAGDRPDIADNVRPDDAAEWTLMCANGIGLVATFDHPRQMATVPRSDGLAADLMREPTSTGYEFKATQTELKGVGKNATWREPRLADTTCTVTEVKPRD